MTPKEKAREIFDTFSNQKKTLDIMHYYVKIACCNILVDEVIAQWEFVNECVSASLSLEYWLEVKEELGRL